MRNYLFVGLLLCSGVVAAHDETPCTQEPEAKWQPFSAAIKKAESMGGVVKNAEVHHKCYEVRGKARDGSRFELILNPVTLAERAGPTK